MSKARYIMIGGFLGAGKTTSIAQFAQRLVSQGLRVGLITNDQGNGLVDTAMLRSRGFATEEIPGGCFCCRFNSLMDAAKKLSGATKPDVFIAEPVGSCTDLVATVTYPLRRIHGDDYTVAPLSVVVDPIRALRIFGLEDGGKFSEKVLYIYRKQLEEADIIVINKSDLLDISKQQQLQTSLETQFPRKTILLASARTQLGLDEWFNSVMAGTQLPGELMLMDYTVYAEGEALLGWLNATVRVSSTSPFDANVFLRDFASRIQSRLNEDGAEIAHLKMTLSPDEGLGDIAAVSLVRNDFVPELSLSLQDEVTSGQLIINLRAEGSPDSLNAALESAMAQVRLERPTISLDVEHREFFRPGKPQPTHRDISLATEPTL